MNFFVWRVETGERLGTYEGHTGSVWDICLNRQATRLLSASADTTVKLWNVETGECIATLEFPTPVRSVNFGFGDKIFLTVTDNVMGKNCFIQIWSISEDETHPIQISSFEQEPRCKVSFARFINENKQIIACIDERIVVFDTKTGTIVKQRTDHKRKVVQLQFDPFETFFVSASEDGTAILYDAETLIPLKTYITGVPVDTASISPVRDHIVTGGGQSAQSVTNTKVDNDQFKAIFFDLVEATEIGRVAGHFGPVHTSLFFPDGSGFATGGEDGYCRVYKFDKTYDPKTLGC